MDQAKRSAARWIKQGILVTALCLLVFGFAAHASPESSHPVCVAPHISIDALGQIYSSSSFFEDSSAKISTVQCLAVTQPTTTPVHAPEIFQFTHTLSNLALFEERARYSEHSAQEYVLRISDGVEVLARHLDWKDTLVKVLLDSQGKPYPPGLLDAASQKEELILRVGDVAQLAAEVDFMTNLMKYLARSLMTSQIPLPTSQNEMTLVFNINGGLADVDVATVLQGAASSDPASWNGVDVSQITVKISNGTITSQAELDPADFSISEGQLEVKFRLGSNSISSTTTFTKGEGLEKEVLVITAQLGALNLTGQATFSSGLPEFKLEASLAGLLSFSALLTSEGFSQPTFGVELRF